MPRGLGGGVAEALRAGGSAVEGGAQPGGDQPGGRGAGLLLIGGVVSGK